MRIDVAPLTDAPLALGFRDIPAYYDTPIAGTLFMALRLDPRHAKKP